MANENGRYIKIFDTTLRDGEQSPGCSMNLPEKLELARQLERLGVDVIEGGFAIASPDDFEAVRIIAETIKNSTVCSLSRALEKDIERAWQAVKPAAKPRIHTFIATSDVHMKYKLRMTGDQVLDRVSSMVKYAKNFCDDVEFSAEDAMRSNLDFLAEAIRRAIAAGALTVNLPDTVGYTTPHEMYDRITYLFGKVPEMEKVTVSTHCHNDLGMAVSNSLAAITAGVTQIECTINGIGERAGNAAMEEVVMALLTRKDFYNAQVGLELKQIYRTSRLLSSIIGIPVPPNKPIVGANAFAHESGIHQHGVLSERTTYEIMSPQSIGIPENRMVLGKHSGRHGFEERLRQLGINLNHEELEAAFEQFKILADKKKTVSDKDLETLTGAQIFRVPETISLIRFIVNSGNTIPGTATVKLMRGDVEYEDSAIGDGPVDAAYKAISKIVGQELLLEDFAIQSVGDGEDAQGEVTVKVMFNSELYIGRGISTDIIEASLLAYINAINKTFI